MHPFWLYFTVRAYVCTKMYMLGVHLFQDGIRLVAADTDNMNRAI